MKIYCHISIISVEVEKNANPIREKEYSIWKMSLSLAFPLSVWLRLWNDYLTIKSFIAWRNLGWFATQRLCHARLFSGQGIAQELKQTNSPQVNCPITVVNGINTAILSILFKCLAVAGAFRAVALCRPEEGTQRKLDKTRVLCTRHSYLQFTAVLWFHTEPLRFIASLGILREVLIMVYHIPRTPEEK